MTSDRPARRTAALAQLDECERETRDALARWGFRESPLDADLATAGGPSGRFAMAAECWRGGAAEARLVRIRGSAAAVFNCMIFPARPGEVPVFVAELLVTGGSLRLAFVDLQVPGMGEPYRASVAAAARRLSALYGGRNTPDPAPPWATECSAGRAAYVRPADPNEEVVVTDLYCGYLKVWAETARVKPGAGADPGAALAELGRFKRHHRDESPVGGFLSRVFGEAWTVRFLDGFLYR